MIIKTKTIYEPRVILSGDLANWEDDYYDLTGEAFDTYEEAVEAGHAHCNEVGYPKNHLYVAVITVTAIMPETRKKKKG